MIHLGYSLPGQYNSIGFTSQATVNEQPELISDTGEASLLTIAPTGAGKGRSNIIPTCLTYKGSLLIIDPKGEAAAVTANVRKRYGKVYIIDPFKTVTQTPDKFNPLDVALTNQAPEQQGIMLAKALQGENPSLQSDPYWDNCANALISGLTIHELTQQRSFRSLRCNLHKHDADYTLAVMLDTKIITNPFAVELVGNYLSLPSDRTRPCVLSTAQQHLALLGDPAVLDSLDGPTSFNIQDLLNGDVMTIYMVIPPNKLNAYAMLLRIWVTSFLYLFSERKTRPIIPTLFILDECANLGRMQSLVSAITLLRSYGLRIWCFFQDAMQLKQLYPNEWGTIINNCDVIQTFGIRTYLMAKELEAILGGVNAVQLLYISPKSGVLIQPGTGFRIMKRLDYLQDFYLINYGYELNKMYR